MTQQNNPLETAEDSHITAETSVPEATDDAEKPETVPEDNESNASELSEETVSEEASVAEADTEGEAAPAEKAPEAAAESDSAAAVRSPAKEKSDKILTLLLCIVFFLAAAGVTIYYITTASKAEFHADCTDTIMWANASVESGHLYDPHFKYACFLPFSISLIMIPLIHLFGLSLTAHIIGMLSFFLLLTVFMLLMLKEILGDIKPALFGTGVFLSMTLCSAKVREIFWGHTIYYSLGILCLVIGMYLFSHLLNLRAKQKRLDKNDKKYTPIKRRTIVTFAILCVFVFLTGMNGITGFTLFTIPFAGAIFAEQLLNKDISITSRRSARVYRTVLVFGALAVIGYMYNNLLVGGLVASYQEANSEFSNMDKWMNNLHSLPMAWLKLFGVVNLERTMFTSLEGIYNLLRIFTAGIIAVMPVIATFFYNKFGKSRRGRLMRIWILIHWTVTAVVLVGYIFGILSAADWRVIPCIGTAVIVTVLFAGWSVKNEKNGSRLAILLMIPIVVSSVSNLSEVGNMPKDGYKDNHLFQLTDILREEGLTKGYATFWNANAITVISGSEVWISDVSLNERGLHLRHYQSSEKWYEDDPDQSEYFLLLTASEYRDLEQYSPDTITEAERVIEETVNKTNYTILVFDHNIISE